MCYLIIYILFTAAIIQITTFNVRQPTVKTISLDRQSVRGDLAILQIDLPINHTVFWGPYNKDVHGYDVMYYISQDGTIPSPYVRPKFDWEPKLTVLTY